MYQRDKEKLNADSECLHCFLKKIKVISNPKIHDWIQPIKHITRFDSWIKDVQFAPRTAFEFFCKG